MSRIMIVLLFNLMLFSYKKEEFFGLIKSNLEKEVKIIESRFPTASGEEKISLKNLLKEKYQFLHNIRHCKAFNDLFYKFKYENNVITILYLGSGAHIAPLEILKTKNFKKVNFIYTEINALVSVHLEYLLRNLLSLNIIKDLEIKLVPLPEANFSSNSQEEIDKWIKKFIEINKQSPPLMISYSFKYDSTDVSINLIINGKSNASGSTAYYKASDFLNSDLIITHDWSFDPRENLSILKSIIDSSCILKKKNIYLLMEDLSKYPQPLDLSLFNIVNNTKFDFGHSEYFTMPNGEKLEYEDEPALYKGAIVVKPDLKFWCSLSQYEREAIFNLILFKDYGFYRRNCDIYKGKIVLSPPLLDIYVGHGYKDISGNNLIQEERFLSDLSEKLIKILSKNNGFYKKKFLCAYLKSFEKNLEGIFKQNEKLLSNNSENTLSNAFLLTEFSKKEFLKAIKSKEKIKEILMKDKKDAFNAIHILKSFFSKNKDCVFDNTLRNKMISGD